MTANRKYKDETPAQFKKRMSLKGKARTSANKKAAKGKKKGSKKKPAARVARKRGKY